MFSLFLQLCLAALTLAAPIDNDPTFTIQADAWQYGTGGGILGFIVLVIDVLAWSECSLRLHCFGADADTSVQWKSSNRTVLRSTRSSGVS